MFEKRNDEAAAQALKTLTLAQFAALGSDAVAYMRPVSGSFLSTLIEDAEFDPEGEYQLLMAADGTPLLVTDTKDAVAEWLGDKTLGIATLH